MSATAHSLVKRKRTSKKRFSHYYQFGFTGTPIFAENALQEGETTAAVFGALLHSYKITDAIRDDKVLKFKVATMRCALCRCSSLLAMR